MKFFSIVELDSIRKYAVYSVEAKEKSEAEDIIWSADGMSAYRGVYTSNELKQIIRELATLAHKHGDSCFYGLRSILSPQEGEKVWERLEMEHVLQGDCAAPEGMWDYFAYTEVEDILSSVLRKITPLNASSAAEKNMAILFEKQNGVKQALTGGPVPR